MKLQQEFVSREEYQKRLANGEFDLYLGEMKTGRTLNTLLYETGSAVNYSRGEFSSLEAAAENYRIGEGDLKQVAVAFDAATPVIPIAYRDGLIFTAADVGELEGRSTWAVYGDLSRLKLSER